MSPVIPGGDIRNHLSEKNILRATRTIITLKIFLISSGDSLNAISEPKYLYS